MVPLPPLEHSKVIERQKFLNARKIRFEINKVQLPIGLEGTFGVIRHPGASLAVPITNEGKVLILRQYRFAVARRMLEFPAGTLEPGEDPLTSMKRELAEEAGCLAKRWDYLGEMVPCPGYSDEVIHLFLARDLEILAEPPAGDEDEDLEVLQMSKKELDHNLSSGNESLDGKTITAWYRARQELGDF
ncbi:NUDIX hydrolase [Prochlorococcus sp. MIT 1300]|uniref:NUDIX hydrolase n=1 Tax=Prochlorococcus sp. MIT 1300 TaxID=3096218 RepID=UPI002A75328F|nr:NUDIX hydrolase [Prochlorococcus sp. MIT 1300]